MKKLIKVLVFVFVLGLGLTFGLAVSSESDVIITMDFHNSGQPEWSEEIFIESIHQGITMDFHNSGQPEWCGEEFTGQAPKTADEVSFYKQIDFSLIHGFKNSGLPETIELTEFRF